MELYTIFNKVIKATHVRSKTIYRFKIIARARSINNKILGFIYTPIIVLWLFPGFLITDFF